MSIETGEAKAQVSRARADNGREAYKQPSTGMNGFLTSERRMWAVLMAALVPWIVVSALAAGVCVALHLVAYAILALLVGYAVVSAALPSEARSYALFLAPSAGILALSALTAFWLRAGLPLVWVSLAWLTLAAIGTIAAWQDRNKLKTATVEYGMAAVLLSVLICALYFIPSAFNDAVLRSDGGFNWFTIDTQLNHAIVASIKASKGLPKMPGTFTAEIRYHFGPYAVTAAISRLTGISAGDALVRVTRAVAQWALFFSCLGLGTMLSIRATGKTLGGIMSVAGLFFYGSVLSLAQPRVVTALPVFFEAGPQFPTNAGPFSHILLGLSLLHALGAVTAIIGLCIVQRTSLAVNSWRVLTALSLPALMATVHSAGGLYCLGVVAVLLFWGALNKPRPWFLMVVMAGLFLGACKLMGYGHSPQGSAAGIRFGQLPIYWWTFVVWFAVALGLRLLSFEWVTQSWESPLSMFVLVSFGGLLAFSWVAALWIGSEHYGVYYLQAIFSILAFSRLPSGFWRRDAREKWVAEWLSFENKGLALFVIAGVVIAVAGYAIHHAAGISYFRYRVVICLGFLALLAVIPRIMRRSPLFSASISLVITGVLLIGFLAWIPPWFKYRTAVQAYDVTLTPAEVHGLQRLHEMAAPDERFATNKHMPTGGYDSLARDSYAYTALSGVPVLLEGSRDGAEDTLPEFETLLRDNDIIFSTTSSDVLRDLARSYGVQWLVARPGTDIALPKPLPAWLVEQPDSGSLKIYRIN